jgi:crotonobetaine/carnitine-CoA ligase
MMPEPFTPRQVLELFPPHDMTLPGFFRQRVESDPLREILVAGEESWSRALVLGEAERLAVLLQRSGVAVGDRVLVLGRNSAEHVFALLACGLIGAVFVPVNPQFNASELAYVVGHASPKVILATSDLHALVAEAATEAGHAPQLLALDRSLWADIPAPSRFSPRQPDEPLLMIYTSGTTGFPKGALHSHRSFILAGEVFVGRMHLQPWDRMLLILPMFHINALFYSVAGSMASTAALVIEERFSASKFWDIAVRHRITQVNMIEAVVSILLGRPEEEYRSHHQIRKAYGIRQSMVERVRLRFGITHPVGGYGMTEIPGVIATPYGKIAPEGSMGRLCAHPQTDMEWAECRIVDEVGQPPADGATGELWVRTSGQMLCYFNDPEQTAAAFSDNWFMTGDLVRRDGDGNYFFVARKKDIIRVRGENVSGAEIDRVLLSHPDVEIAAAIGVPGRMGDEDILALVRLRPGGTVTPAGLRDWCAAKMSAIKVPAEIRLVRDLPLTPTHKVQKAQLKKQILADLQE